MTNRVFGKPIFGWSQTQTPKTNLLALVQASVHEFHFHDEKNFPLRFDLDSDLNFVALSRAKLEKQSAKRRVNQGLDSGNCAS